MMQISYKKLWKLLIDRNMSKMDLLNSAHLSTGTLSKLSKNMNVSTGILVRICEVLQCDISDIAEVISKGSDDK